MENEKSFEPVKWTKSMSLRRRASLDEVMEEIFHPSRENFSLADLGAGHSTDRAGTQFNARFGENDYKSHRTESHHNYHPLHRIHSRHLRPIQREESPADSDPARAKSDDFISRTSSQTQLDSNDGAVQTCSESCIEDLDPQSLENLVDSVSDLSGRSPLRSALKKVPERDSQLAVVSGPSSSTKSSESLRPSKTLAKTPIAEEEEKKKGEKGAPWQDKLKVKFILGASDMDVRTKVVEKDVSVEHDASLPKEKTASATPKKMPRRFSHPDYKCADLTLRKHQGSDLGSKSYAAILEPDEAKDLPTADIDDLASHRFDDPKGIRRHKIRRQGQMPEGHMFPVKKEFDHRPHEIFVQLDELLMDLENRELVWRETARWIKYEEDVHVSADRWGRPHVASLSFHSLLSVRYYIESGVLLLDLEEIDFDRIIDRIVDSMIQAELLPVEQKASVVQNLLLRHRHGNVRIPHPVLRRTSSTAPNLHSTNSDKNIGHVKNARSDSAHPSNSLSPETDVLIPKEGIQKGNNDVMPSFTSIRIVPSHEDFHQNSSGILRRIPNTAEGTIVLVGAMDTLDEPAAAFVRLSEGHVIPYLLEVPLPVRFLFILLGPPEFMDLDYHEMGRSISTLMSNTQFNEAAYKAVDRKDLLSAINSFLDDSVVLPPGDFEKPSLLPLDEIRRKSIQYKKKLLPDIVDEPLKKLVYDPLKRTGRCFGGFVADISRRYPLYASDIKDGLNSQCLASAFFIYFASLAGTIAFGGLLEGKTKKLIGVSEALVVTCLVGLVVSIFACQPLIIMGTTGPIMLFDEILFKLCSQHSMSFLTIRFWVGFFAAIIGTIVVGLEGSTLVRYFSRFMQEIYAFVIAMMFIVESFMMLIQVFKDNPLISNYSFNATIPDDKHHRPNPNTALLSTFLMLGTFYIALFLRKLRNSNYLLKQARRALGDFGVPIAMAIMVLIDFLIKDVYTQKLNVPEGLKPTNPDVRGWIISPIPITMFELFTASIGGILIFILLFLETQICQLVVGKKERNLKKGGGFHADTMLVSYTAILSGLLGGPWVSPAIVRSISHVSSITIWSTTHAPGEMAHIVEVKEQRVTNFFVSLFIGVSVFMIPLLQRVPTAVLFGVFLYMGVSSLSGIQLWERLKLMLILPKHHPDEHRYVSEVPAKKMYLFTVIQLACVAVMWAIKDTPMAPAFPFALIGLVFVHSFISRFFTAKELQALDGDEEPAAKEDVPDFYEQIVA